MRRTRAPWRRIRPLFAIRHLGRPCAGDWDFLLLLNAHHEAVSFRISHELYHSGWRIAFDTARPDLEIDKESVKRNRLVNLTARSFVVLSHDR